MTISAPLSQSCGSPNAAALALDVGPASQSVGPVSAAMLAGRWLKSTSAARALRCADRKHPAARPSPRHLHIDEQDGLRRAHMGPQACEEDDYFHAGGGNRSPRSIATKKNCNMRINNRRNRCKTTAPLAASVIGNARRATACTSYCTHEPVHSAH
jgi:hypothetical protein